MLLTRFIRAVTGIPQGMTFLDLFHKSRKTLYVSVCNLTTKKIERWCHLTHPHVSVLYALRISCSIPFIFQSVTHNGHVYVDGAVGDAVPTTQQPQKTLNIRFVNTQTEVSSMQDFLEALVSVQNSPPVRFDIQLEPGDVHSLAFGLEKSQARRAFLSGKDQARTFIKKTM